VQSKTDTRHVGMYRLMAHKLWANRNSMLQSSCSTCDRSNPVLLPTYPDAVGGHLDSLAEPHVITQHTTAACTQHITAHHSMAWLRAGCGMLYNSKGLALDRHECNKEEVKRAHKTGGCVTYE
jgi:hypothetical protein